jgi:urease accessory protein
MTSVASELAAYQDEPRQMRSGAPGKRGVLEMRFERRGPRSVLARLHRRAPLLVQQALYWDEALPGLPCVYVITTSGCVLQGDRFAVSIDLAPGAMAHVTTQAATKIHSMDANHATQTQHFVLEEDSYLEYLPGVTIPHRHSRFATHTLATVAGSATLVTSEILMPGRKYHGDGELFEYDLYSSTTTAERPGVGELFTDRFVVDPAHDRVRGVGAMHRFDVLGTVVVVTPTACRDRIYDRVVSGDGGTTDDSCIDGVHRLPNDAGVIYRVLGMEPHEVKARIRAFWALTRWEVLGAAIPPAPLWG